MRSPPQITFHRTAPSEVLEAHIRDRIDELDTLFDGIVSCHVSIDGPHRSPQGGLYRVLVELGVPGEQILATGSSDGNPAHADAYVAVRDAFRAARRQLQDYVGGPQRDVKPHLTATAR